MSIIYLDGDIFKSTKQTLVNPVCCNAVMGAGLALLFRQKFPGLFDDYIKKCKSGELLIGKPCLFKTEKQWILNFPTKDRWQDFSKMEYISNGLKYLVDHYEEMEITSLSIPCLGGGLGGLDSKKVFKVMENYLSKLPIEIEFYFPKEKRNERNIR